MMTIWHVKKHKVRMKVGLVILAWIIIEHLQWRKSKICILNKIIARGTTHPKNVLGSIEPP